MSISKNPAATAVEVGLPSGVTTTGMLYRDAVTHVGGADEIEEIIGEDNEIGCYLISRDADTYDISGIKTTASTVPRKGAVVTINLVKYLVIDSSTRYGVKAAVSSCRVKKPAALTLD